MSRFFVDRPIFAISLSILIVLLGIVAMLGLPIALYPNIAPPEILVQATYVGADALALEKAVAAPIEQQMTGVDNMLYMYSTSASTGGQMNLRVDFDITTNPSTDQVLAQMRYSQAASQLPPAGHRGRRHDQEVRLEPARALLALLAQGHVRSALHQQLRLYQHQRSDDACSRHRAGPDLRRRAVRHALLGRSGHRWPSSRSR